MEIKSYAAINLNDELRKISSSGAIFYELLSFVISKKGIVFGAAFDTSWNVRHSHAETMEDAIAFLGSKYVQSYMGNEYNMVKQYLKSGRMVLFSGMPCQISGLKAYLGQSYENLITIDLICHGVPSPTVWQKYLDELSKGRTVKSINFREKTEGWLDFSLKIEFTNGSIYRKNHRTDLYMKGFLQDIYLRPSCYACKFKGMERCADITLADFWGVQDILQEMFDNKGTSLVFLHSEVGEKIWEELHTKLCSCEISIDKALKGNSNALTSVAKNSKRDKFYKSNKGNIAQLKRLTQLSFKQKVKRLLKKIADKKRKKR